MKKISFLLVLFPFFVLAQTNTTQLKSEIGSYFTQIAKLEKVSIGKIVVDSIINSKKEAAVYLSENGAYIPYRPENISKIYSDVKKLLPAEYQKSRLVILALKQPIEAYIPLPFMDKKGKKEKTFEIKTKIPLVTDVSSLNKPTKGLGNRHIAMWQSHGWYFEQKLNRWEWQRARIFETVEDLYTQSYVLPFLVPMLENAGANVILPRERDWQKNEIIADNDKSIADNFSYKETNGKNSWSTGDSVGFAHLKTQYIDFDNPFRDGTYRQTTTLKKGNASTITWEPNFSDTGKYAVYVSYKSVKNSTEDALYTVYHKGGETTFKVNQTMGGGTWIYLGKFNFEKGENSSNKVVLSNISSKNGKIVTADAVKFGGGIGNIAREPSVEMTENTKSSEAQNSTIAKTSTINYKEQTSKYPRYTEAARYWLQWAGVPDTVYSESHGKNDYTDDYRSRGKWVNYMSGGSKSNPNEKGLNIPVDLSFAFHSDAGTTMDDSIIGTLAIFSTENDNGLYGNGISRKYSHDLADLVQSQIVKDIRTKYEPKWSRRGMWNQKYYEAKVPKVPAMLLELLSHQNFADMRYGLDPRFRFTVSRAIYKGMLQFISSQNHTDYIVQPLPVDNMNLKLSVTNEVELSWKAVNDSLEPTAKPDSYIVYKRIGDGDFDNGTSVQSASYQTTIPEGKVCSFKVTAINKGGESFPSEILSAGIAPNSKGTVLVVNGFDRISAPADFVASHDSIAGFYDELDHGVPYIEDISYIGRMKEFRRKVPWMDDNASGFGDSYGNYETDVIAGNTFDYPALHGKSILEAGFSFISSSNEAVDNGITNLNDYKIVDLILGKQYQSKMGRGGVYPIEFKTFSPKLESVITDYCKKGGNIFVSGAFVATDLWDNRNVPMLKNDTAFAMNTLKYKWLVGQAAITGKIEAVTSPFDMFSGNYLYYNKPNNESYVVESPDGILPASDDAFTIFRYTENGISAGVAYNGSYKSCVLGFPFESIKTNAGRNELMEEILNFLN